MEHLIITVHGIRTHGDWQARLSELIAAECARTQTTAPRIARYQFGYFSAPALAVPLLRQLEINRFARWLRRLLADNSNCSVAIVAHSFGTFVVARALLKLPPTDLSRVNKLVFAASILPQSFPWERLVGANGVSVVINDCGIKDTVLVLAQLAVIGGGLGGRLGFFGLLDNRGLGVVNRYFSFGHSGYFSSYRGIDFMSQYWVPVLLGANPAPHDERSSGIINGIWTTVLQNLAAAKIAIYMCLILAAAAAVYLPQLYEVRQRLIETNYELARSYALADDPRRALGPITELLKLNRHHSGGRFLLPRIEGGLPLAVDPLAVDPPLIAAAVSGDGTIEVGWDPTRDLNETDVLELHATGLHQSGYIESLRKGLLKCNLPATDISYSNSPVISYSGHWVFAPGADTLCDAQHGISHPFASGSLLVAMADHADVVAVASGHHVEVWKSDHPSSVLAVDDATDIITVALSPSGAWMGTINNKGRLTIRSISGGAILSMFAGHSQSVQLSEIGSESVRVLACGFQRAAAKDNDSEHGRATLCPFRNSSDRFFGVEQPTGRLDLSVWDVDSGGATKLGSGIYDQAMGAALMPSQDVLFVVTKAGVKVVGVDGAERALLTKEPTLDLAVSHNGETVAVVDSQGTVTLFASQSGRQIRRWALEDVSKVMFSAGEEYLVAWEPACTMRNICGNVTQGSIQIIRPPFVRSFASNASACTGMPTGGVADARADFDRTACELAARLQQEPPIAPGSSGTAPLIDPLIAQMVDVQITTATLPRGGMTTSAARGVNSSHVSFALRGATSALTATDVAGDVVSATASKDLSTFALLICKQPLLQDYCHYEVKYWRRRHEADIRSLTTTTSYIEEGVGARIVLSVDGAYLYQLRLSSGNQLGDAYLRQYRLFNQGEREDEIALLSQADADEVRDVRWWVSADRRYSAASGRHTEWGGLPGLGVYDLSTMKKVGIAEDSGGVEAVTGTGTNGWFAGVQNDTQLVVWDLPTGKTLARIAPAAYSIDVGTPPSDEPSRPTSVTNGEHESPCQPSGTDYTTAVLVSGDSPVVALRCGRVIDVLNLAM